VYKSPAAYIFPANREKHRKQKDLDVFVRRRIFSHYAKPELLTRALTAACLTAVMFLAAAHPARAQDEIPETSGFRGFAVALPGYFSIQSNLLVKGPPLIDDVGNTRIDSIFTAPGSQTAAALAVAVEINYTFASTGTQVFLGNRLEDLLRLDVSFGLGVRQDVGKGGILAASVLTTPFENKVWADPYVEGEDRVATKVNRPGIRLRWSRVMQTGLELTLTARDYRHDTENSGDWLIDQGRLDPADQPLLNREGTVWRAQALYRIDSKNRKHRFEPTLRYNNDSHDGAAIANQGLTAKLTYLYFTPKVIFDVNAVLGRRKADEIHPVYGQTLDWNRYGGALTLIIPVKQGEKSRLNVLVGGEYFRETSNIDFFDTKIASVHAGVLWRYRGR